MSKEKIPKIKIRFYEYPLYWLVSLVVLLLAIPILLLKFVVFLVKSIGAPLKSVKHLLGFLLVIIILAGLVAGYEIFMPYDIGFQTKSIMIEENDNFRSVMNNLKEAEILRGEHLFKITAVLFKIDKSLAPGRYDFSGKISIYDILYKLKNYDITTVLITVPEGYTVKKTAGIFAQTLGIDSSDFVDRAFDTSFIRQKYNLSNMEGYLFPETYRLSYGIGINDIFDMMYSHFNSITEDLVAKKQIRGEKLKDIIILASIIEAEAMAGDEKRLISSVYNNRLKKKMLLQADPTVLYVLDDLDRSLWYRDLKIDSPYNTYKHKGLPPGPINSPGLEAIKAALNPQQTDYLYFVADGTGRHIFSKSLKEHNRAKNKIKRENKKSD